MLGSLGSLGSQKDGKTNRRARQALGCLLLGFNLPPSQCPVPPRNALLCCRDFGEVWMAEAIRAGASIQVRALVAVSSEMDVKHTEHTLRRAKKGKLLTSELPGPTGLLVQAGHWWL